MQLIRDMQKIIMKSERDPLNPTDFFRGRCEAIQYGIEYLKGIHEYTNLKTAFHILYIDYIQRYLELYYFDFEERKVILMLENKLIDVYGECLASLPEKQAKIYKEIRERCSKSKKRDLEKMKLDEIYTNLL